MSQTTQSEPILEEPTEIRIQRPRRMKLTREEVLKRMEAFPEREEEFIASIRKGKDRGLHTRPDIS